MKVNCIYCKKDIDPEIAGWGAGGRVCDTKCFKLAMEDYKPNNKDLPLHLKSNGGEF